MITGEISGQYTRHTWTASRRDHDNILISTGRKVSQPAVLCKTFASDTYPRLMPMFSGVQAAFADCVCPRSGVLLEKEVGGEESEHPPQSQRPQTVQTTDRSIGRRDESLMARQDQKAYAFLLISAGEDRM